MQHKYLGIEMCYWRNVLNTDIDLCEFQKSYKKP